jgi:putative intracellular protease/amidase
MRSIFVLFFAVSLISPWAAANPKVLMMVPDDFMWPEYQIPRAEYEKAGFTVKTAGRFEGEVRPDRRNKKDFPESTPIKVDLTFDQVNTSDFDAISFVAGNGAWHDFFPTQRVHDLILEARSKDKVIGLLCASTGLLGLVGNWNGTSKPIAQGKKVVGYFRVEGILKNMGKVNFVSGERNEVTAVADGNLVTGRNPESSQAFADLMVKTIKSRKQ